MRELALLAFGILLASTICVLIPVDVPLYRETRVRYPGEEAKAQAACGERKLMYWWVGDPRRSGAVMHVECAGRVSKTVDVKF